MDVPVKVTRARREGQRPGESAGWLGEHQCGSSSGSHRDIQRTVARISQIVLIYVAPYLVEPVLSNRALKTAV
jgi:hypothetical protein